MSKRRSSTKEKEDRVDRLESTMLNLAKVVEGLAQKSIEQDKIIERKDEELSNVQAELTQAKEIVGLKLDKAVEFLKQPNENVPKTARVSNRRVTELSKDDLVSILRTKITAADALLWLEDNGWLPKYLSKA